MRKRLSPSMLRIARWCMRRLYYQYVKFPDRRWAPSAAAATGRAVHGAVEQNLVRRIEKGTYMPHAEVVDVAADAFEAEAFEVDWRHETETNEGQEKDRVVKMALAHRQRVAPRLHPLAVEEKLTAQIAGTDWVLVGKADVICRGAAVSSVSANGQASGSLVEAREIRDTKTKNGAPQRICGQPKVLGDDRVQAATYRLIWAANNQPAIRSWVDYLWTSNHEGQAAPAVVSLADHEVANALEDYAELIRVLGGGVFPRTGYGTWMCAPGQCAHYDLCIMGKDRSADL